MVFACGPPAHRAGGTRTRKLVFRMRVLMSPACKNKNTKRKIKIAKIEPLPSAAGVIPPPSSSHRCHRQTPQAAVTIVLLSPLASSSRCRRRPPPAAAAVLLPPPPPDPHGSRRGTAAAAGFAGDGRQPVDRHRAPHATFVALPPDAAVAPHRFRCSPVGRHACWPLPPSPQAAFVTLSSSAARVGLYRRRPSSLSPPFRQLPRGPTFTAVAPCRLRRPSAGRRHSPSQESLREGEEYEERERKRRK
uniref:Uncharacterized protein n=1 Tax=Oryza sativa subsp. japonica TaxID=39947 RepID=Q67TN7_ORYSJ|nr:hypothetical protein [Oryza sativa Japonica Group]BAD38484.1 hypothetical protein [Oryza sativa Japonica Group]